MQPEERRHYHVLRQAVPQVRAAHRDLPRLQPAWVPVVPTRRSSLAAREALHEVAPRRLNEIEDGIDWEQLQFCEHHLSHAASAFYPSPFERAAVLTMDGVGEWATTSAAVGSGAKLAISEEIHFPHSLGLLYSAFTYYTGFKVNSGEYKLMGLAP